MLFHKISEDAFQMVSKTQFEQKTIFGPSPSSDMTISLGESENCFQKLLLGPLKLVFMH